MPLILIILLIIDIISSILMIILEFEILVLNLLKNIFFRLYYTWNLISNKFAK